MNLFTKQKQNQLSTVILKGSLYVGASRCCLHESNIVVVQSLSCIQLLATPWTVACQAPLSMGFPGKNTGVDCHFLLQEIFLTQESNLHLSPVLAGEFLTTSTTWEGSGSLQDQNMLITLLRYIFSYLLQRCVRCLFLKTRTTFKIIALDIIV